MISVNARAMQIVEEMRIDKERLGVKVNALPCGTQVLDCTYGGIEAGRCYSCVCTGGLAEISFSSGRVHVSTDNPLLACMASQYAGWNIKVKYKREGEERKFSASGSGPARSLARVEKLFDEIDYKDSCERAIITLEVRDSPGDEVAEFIAQKCGVIPENLCILFAPTASLVGSVQISARVVEVGMHKMRLLGFDLRKIVSACGSAPIPPVGKDDRDAMGKSNDCILYGGETHYSTNCPDEEIEKIIEKVPSSSSKDYGKPFARILAQSNFEFFKIDPSLFAPASVAIDNVKTGKTWKVGKIDREILEKSLCAC